MDCKICNSRKGFQCHHEDVSVFRYHRLGTYCDKGTSPSWCPLEKEEAMSIHGTCHDNGNSGNCNRDCEQFQDGDCPAGEAVENRFPQCDGCRHQDEYEFQCDHPNATKTQKRHDIEAYNDEGTAPAWCPIAIEQSELNIKQRMDDMTDKKFDFDKSTAQVKGNALNAFDTAKNVVVQMQQGKAVLVAVKAALIKAPGLPDGMKVALGTAYGDLIVGLVLHTMAPILTGSPIVMKAVKAANVAGAVELSGQFTFIQDAIESSIGSIPGFEDMKTIVEQKVSDIAQPEDVRIECPKCEGMFKNDSMRDGLCHACWNTTDPTDTEE